jgi:hypothetical protein
MKVDSDPAGDIIFTPETAEDERLLDRIASWPVFYPAKRAGTELRLIPFVTAAHRPPQVILEARKRFRKQWQAVTEMRMNDREKTMIHVFVGRENQFLSNADFPSLWDTEQYALNEKLKHLFYQKKLGSHRWVIRRIRNTFKLDTTSR